MLEEKKEEKKPPLNFNHVELHLSSFASTQNYDGNLCPCVVFGSCQYTNITLYSLARTRHK